MNGHDAEPVKILVEVAHVVEGRFVLARLPLSAPPSSPQRFQGLVRADSVDMLAEHASHCACSCGRDQQTDFSNRSRQRFTSSAVEVHVESFCTNGLDGQGCPPRSGGLGRLGSRDSRFGHASAISRIFASTDPLPPASTRLLLLRHDLSPSTCLRHARQFLGQVRLESRTPSGRVSSSDRAAPTPSNVVSAAQRGQLLSRQAALGGIQNVLVHRIDSMDVLGAASALAPWTLDTLALVEAHAAAKFV